jgi:hypothetical protein
MNTVASLNDAN